MERGTTYYVLDAQGEKALLLKTESLSGKTESSKEMSVYERVVNTSNQTVTYEQTEKYLYGSSRLGVHSATVGLLGTQNGTYSQTVWTHTIGQRTYELSNHLGNVLSVISDKVLPHANGTTVDYYLADIRQSSDYSPFGVQLSGRNFVKSGAKEGRFGFQGQEEDDEIKGDGNSVNYTFRMHDPRLGRFFAIDPLTKNYPHYTPYYFSGNNVINSIELEGAEPLTLFVNLNANLVYYTSVTSYTQPLLFITNSHFIRREFTTLESTFAGNREAVELARSKLPAGKANVRLPGTVGTTRLEHNCTMLDDGIGRVFFNVTKMSNPTIQADGTDFKSNGTYSFTPDFPNSVENNINSTINQANLNPISIACPIANNADLGVVEFNENNQPDNFQLTDELGNIIPLTPMGGGAPVLMGNGTLVNGTAPQYTFTPPTGVNQLTITVFPQTIGGGSFDVLLKTAGPADDAVTTPVERYSPNPLNNVEHKIRGLFVFVRTASECGKSAVNE